MMHIAPHSNDLEVPEIGIVEGVKQGDDNLKRTLIFSGIGRCPDEHLCPGILNPCFPLLLIEMRRDETDGQPQDDCEECTCQPP